MQLTEGSGGADVFRIGTLLEVRHWPPCASPLPG